MNSGDQGNAHAPCAHGLHDATESRGWHTHGASELSESPGGRQAGLGQSSAPGCEPSVSRRTNQV